MDGCGQSMAGTEFKAHWTVAAATGAQASVTRTFDRITQPHGYTCKEARPPPKPRYPAAS